MTFLPGGDRLAAIYSDGTFGLIPLDGRPPVYHNRFGGDTSVALAVLSGDRLVAAYGSRLRIFDLVRNDWSGAEYHPPSGIQSFAVSADGSRAVVGLSTGGIKVVALPEAREELNLFGHASSVVAVAYSPDGKTIASACVDGVVRLWHAATGQELFLLENRQRRAVTSLSFTSDGRLLVAGNAFPNGHTITVHDPSKPPN
jgi:WD40 repeat protein